MTITKKVLLAVLALATIIVAIPVFDIILRNGKDVKPNDENNHTATAFAATRPAFPPRRSSIITKRAGAKHRVPDDIPGILAQDRVLALGDCYVREGGKYYWNVDYENAVIHCLRDYGAQILKDGTRPAPPTDWEPPAHSPQDETRDKAREQTERLAKRAKNQIDIPPEVLRITKANLERVKKKYTEMVNFKLSKVIDQETKLLRPDEGEPHDFAADILEAEAQLQEALDEYAKEHPDIVEKIRDMSEQEKLEFRLSDSNYEEPILKGEAQLEQALEEYTKHNPILVGEVRQKLWDEAHPQRLLKRGEPNLPAKDSASRPEEVFKGGKPTQLRTDQPPWLNDMHTVMTAVENGMDTPDQGLHVMARLQEDYAVARYMIDALGMAYDYGLEMIAWWQYRDEEVEQLVHHGYSPMWEEGRFNHGSWTKPPENVD